MSFVESPPRLVVDCCNFLGEGPTWDERRGMLWWVDTKGQRVHWLKPESGETGSRDMGNDVGSLGLCESGRLVVALRHKVVWFDPDDDVVEPFIDLSWLLPEERLNDGKIGPDGAFWVGTMHETEIELMQPIGSLYRIDPNGEVAKVVSDLKVSNGLAWSPDGRLMYHSDSCAPWLDLWDFDPDSGQATNRRRIATPTEEVGRPDGAAMDAEGRYWSAGVSASRLNIWNSAGQLLESVPVPGCPKPTMPCFGGKDLKDVFITGHRNQMTPEVLQSFPHAGSLFAVRSRVPGLLSNRFRDVPPEE